MKYSLNDALKTHFLRYRKMTPQDTVKLIYQSEFGPGHLIKDKGYARARLSQEREDTPRDDSIPTVEPIGGKACRINLASVPETLSSDTLTEIFTLSAEMFSGDEHRFESKLYGVYDLIDEKYAPFSRLEYSEFLKKYFAAGGGALHHSLYYSSFYRPAYRVVHTSFAPILKLLYAIDERLGDGERFTLKIDGRCGSGKSTLADTLSKIYGCGIIHTDDFYPTAGSDSPLDFDRLNREFDEIASGKADSYGAFDCHTQTVNKRINVKNGPFWIVEGTYSCHKQVNFGDASVFVTADDEVRLERLKRRNPEAFEAFRTRWIPAEERYFAEFGIAENCDFVIDTSDT